MGAAPPFTSPNPPARFEPSGARSLGSSRDVVKGKSHRRARRGGAGRPSCNFCCESARAADRPARGPTAPFRHSWFFPTGRAAAAAATSRAALRNEICRSLNGQTMWRSRGCAGPAAGGPPPSARGERQGADLGKGRHGRPRLSTPDARTPSALRPRSYPRTGLNTPPRPAWCALSGRGYPANAGRGGGAISCHSGGQAKPHPLTPFTLLQTNCPPLGPRTALFEPDDPPPPPGDESSPSPGVALCPGGDQSAPSFPATAPPGHAGHTAQRRSALAGRSEAWQGVAGRSGAWQSLAGPSGPARCLAGRPESPQ